ncbi:MAG: HypC/HybG/HupF family hydrogenase formation chaperone [Methylocystis sp.]|uniref:HypC/HybG/HupF family hydrogenase formation chaperone n=1 Tax=Methylocystis sp. TaxID=1911079 RepID=UPI003DA66ED7
MCLGFPMTVVSGDALQAICARKGETQMVSMLLVGEQPAGARVLVHLGSAMRVLDETEADAIDAALDGLSAALNGASFEHFFADIIDREPELPEHLRSRTE